jgi:hypothetical protein
MKRRTVWYRHIIMIVRMNQQIDIRQDLRNRVNETKNGVVSTHHDRPNRQIDIKQDLRHRVNETKNCVVSTHHDRPNQYLLIVHSKMRYQIGFRLRFQ